MHEKGLSLIEALAALALMALGLTIWLPGAAHARARGAAAAATREIAGKLHDLRWKSVAAHRHHGLFFVEDGSGWSWFEVRDENRNGLRTAEIRNGTDSTLSGPHRLDSRYQGMRLGFPADMTVVKSIPPRSGNISPLDDPVRFGRGDLVSFSPLGSSSSGTLYLTDGKDQLWAVVLFGPSARVRVWRYLREENRWKL